jgi:pimeloyl-ACP methyl ester carboxylesterase
VVVTFDRGSGPPLVVVPGVQGRWEWSRPALQLMAARCRTISYSLCGDIGSGCRMNPALGFDNYVRQLDRQMDRAGVARAAICGVSYGGLVALRYAAEHPERVSALILVSTPGPGFRPNATQARWLARPWRSAPLFVATFPQRVWPEICAGIPDWRGRMTFSVLQAARCAAAPMVPSLMASRMRALTAIDAAAECRRLSAPALIITGESSLDGVVPVSSTREYTTLIPGAEYTILTGTGHMGPVTRPGLFATIVSDFAHAHHP